MCNFSIALFLSMVIWQLLPQGSAWMWIRRCQSSDNDLLTEMTVMWLIRASCYFKSTISALWSSIAILKRRRHCRSALIISFPQQPKKIPWLIHEKNHNAEWVLLLKGFTLPLLASLRTRKITSSAWSAHALSGSMYNLRQSITLI